MSGDARQRGGCRNSRNNRSRHPRVHRGIYMFSDRNFRSGHRQSATHLKDKLPGAHSYLSLGAVSFFALMLPAQAVAQTVQGPANETTAVVDEDDTVIVTATRSSTPIEDSPRSLSVIPETTLEERPGTGGIQSIIAETPGVTFARTGGLGGQLVMRGFNSGGARSVLSLNGDRFRGRTALEYNLIDQNAIERIEIIRGPASSVLGPDAMNGVVNVVTRKANVDVTAPFSMAAHLRALEYNSSNALRAGRVELVGGGNGFDVLVGLNARKADDYRTPQGIVGNSDFFSRGVDFRAGYSPDGNQRFEVSGRYQLADAGQANSPGAPIFEVWQDPLKEEFLRLGYTRTGLGWLADDVDASAYVRSLKTDIYQLSRMGPVNDALTHIANYTPTVYGGHLTLNKTAGDHSLSYGFDTYYEDFRGRQSEVTTTNRATGVLVSQTPLAYQERGAKQTNIGVFINDDWQLTPQLSLSAGARYDWIRTELDATPLPGETPARQAVFASALETTSTPLTGTVGAIYEFVPGFELVANVSRGFRAPSGQDKAMTATAAGITTLPAPTLKPERNTNYEVGLRAEIGSHRVNLVSYWSDYEDLIVVANLNATTRQRQNISSAEVSGLELDGHWIIDPNWSARYTLSTTRGTDKFTGRPLPNIAPLYGRASLRYEPSDFWYLEGAVRGSNGKTRIDTTAERPTEDYTLVDLYFGVDLGAFAGDKWKMVVGVENLFDEEARNPAVVEDLRYSNTLIGNPLLEPGRSVVMKFTADY